MSVLMCSVEGCGPTTFLKKGMCGKHYQRIQNNGTLELRKTENGKRHAQHGYWAVTINGIRQYEHILIAEKALGKKLPLKAIVHHIDDNGLNNANHNLVVCPDTGYHRLIHLRQDSLDACGNANWIKCGHCKIYDDPHIMWVHPTKLNAMHRKCNADYQRAYRRGEI